METINVDQLMAEIRQEVARQVNRRKPQPPPSKRQNPSDLLALSGTINQVEAVLNLAESRSHVRTHLPDKFQSAPLVSGKLKNLMLRLFNLTFRDQREVNAGIIQAARHSAQVNQQIIDELMRLRTQVSQLQAQLDQSHTKS
jgi:hypothetical protein